MTLRDGITSRSYLYDNGDSPGPLNSIFFSGVELNFVLLSNSMGVLNSTLAFQANSVLNNAEIECEGRNTRVHTFKLAGMFGRACNNNIHSSHLWFNSVTVAKL